MFASPLVYFEVSITCIKYAKDITSPGPDGVRCSHMKTLDEECETNLKELLENSLFECNIPEDWLNLTVTCAHCPSQRKILQE